MEVREFESILDQLEHSVFLTDTETDEILFMNRKMKEEYGIQVPEGKKCYEVLQNQSERCRFCRIPALMEREPGTVLKWRENDEKAGRTFDNYDSLVYWAEGELVHLQQAVDITDTMELRMQAKQDKLCGILNRRGGKNHLSEVLAQARKEGKSLVLGMLDVDNLKMTNDRYGYSEGDQLLLQIVTVLKRRIQEPDFIFRLSGDEFVYVAVDQDEKETARFLLDCLREMNEEKERRKKPYEISFSFGLYTVTPQEKLTVSDVIAKADEMMYTQKLRRRKTRMLQRKEQVIPSEVVQGRDFEFDTTLLYDALIKSTDDFIYICNMKTGKFRYSPSQVYLFDLPGEILDNPLPLWKEIVHPDDWARFYKSNMEIGENQMDYHSVEFRAKDRNGEYLWLRCRGQLMRDECGEPVIFAGIMTQLGKHNKIDPVTQLLNHNEFIRVFEGKTADRMIECMAVLVLDLDNFKQVNEMYDRAFGDHILRTVAQSIQSILPDNASLFKLDNDRMGILLDNEGAREAEALYHRIQELLAQMHLWKQYRLKIEVSGGCVMYPEHGDMATELYKYADYSVRYAKEHGKNRLVFFSEEILEGRLRALELLGMLRESINDRFRGFELCFQPQVDAKSCRIIGAEVLLRWSDPEGKPVSPMEFIPILEENGMISQVGEWVLHQAMAQSRQWVQDHPSFCVSVNVSSIQFLEHDFIKEVLRAVREEQFPCQNLVLELTESYAAPNMSLLRDKFDALRAQGIRIALDDFGTGYSSLELLKFSPIDVVKIDRVFVKDILNSKFDATFIQFVVAICHDAGIRVCLEGVETMEEYGVIDTMNLDYIQGYLFGKPQTREELSRNYFDQVHIEQK